MLRWSLISAVIIAGLWFGLGSGRTALPPPEASPPLAPPLALGTAVLEERDIYAAIVSQCMDTFGGGPSWMWCHCATLNIMTFGTDIEQLIIADCGRAPRAA